MNIIRIDKKNIYLLESFLQTAGDSLKTFRYFASRPMSVLNNHLCTWVIEEAGNVEAYGHLDCEDKIVWLGIAVTQESQGRALGRKMMRKLMDSAESLGVQVVRLSVDNTNEVAIRLYKSFGFQLIEEHESFGVYEWRGKNDP